MCKVWKHIGWVGWVLLGFCETAGGIRRSSFLVNISSRCTLASATHSRELKIVGNAWALFGSTLDGLVKCCLVIGVCGAAEIIWRFFSIVIVSSLWAFAIANFHHIESIRRHFMRVIGKHIGWTSWVLRVARIYERSRVCLMLPFYTELFRSTYFSESMFSLTAREYANP